MVAAVEVLQVEGTAALAHGDGRVHALGPGLEPRSQRVFLHALQEGRVVHGQDEGADDGRGAVAQRHGVAVQREDGRARGIADADVRVVVNARRAQREGIEAADQDALVARAFREVDRVLAARRALEFVLQRGALCVVEREVGLPLAQRERHGQARPVQHAVVALRQAALDLAALHPVHRGLPQLLALGLQQGDGRVVTRRTGQSVLAQLECERRPELVEAAGLQQLLREARRIAGAELVGQALLFVRGRDAGVHRAPGLDRRRRGWWGIRRRWRCGRRCVGSGDRCCNGRDGGRVSTATSAATTASRQYRRADAQPQCIPTPGDAALRGACGVLRFAVVPRRGARMKVACHDESLP
ncbi:hypothetical protein D3C72_1266780 [compost metagenome]